jgi:hypothetical protein
MKENFEMMGNAPEQKPYDRVFEVCEKHGWNISSVQGEGDLHIQEIQEQDPSLLKAGFHSIENSEHKIVGISSDGSEFVAFIGPDHSRNISANVYVKGESGWQYWGGNHDFVLSELEGTIKNAHVRG